MKKTFISLALAALIFSGCGAQAKDIGADKAKEIAISHAGINAQEANFIRTDKDRENGKTVYDIEFYSKDKTEYDYEIDAETGDIISYDSEVENFTPETQNNSVQDTNAEQGGITDRKAKGMALAKVSGATEADIREFKKERDDGREEYEGKIIYNNTEYEFEIDAASGEIIKWETESVHD